MTRPARARAHFETLTGILETLTGILPVHGHVDEQAAAGPDAVNTFMPPKTCPDGPCEKPTEDERRQLGEWLQCAVEERDNPSDAGPPDAVP